MKQNFTKKLIFLFYSFSIILSLSACGINLQVGPNPNLEEGFESYDDNKTLAKDNQGYSEDLTYTFYNNTYEISGKDILWGDVELVKINTSEQTNCQLTGAIKVNKGNYKIIKINSKNEVTVLAEDEMSFDNSVVLEKGINIIKVVGKPVDFYSLNIKIVIPETIEDTDSGLPKTEQEQSAANLNKVDEIEQKESANNEEGDFWCANYLQEGNILLSGKLTTLNGNKVLLNLDLQEGFDLYLKIKCKLKGGSYNIALQDGKGNQKSIVSDEEEWKGNIVLDEGVNTIILIGDNASFSSIIIESNSEDINPEYVKH